MLQNSCPSEEVKYLTGKTIVTDFSPWDEGTFDDAITITIMQRFDNTRENLLMQLQYKEYKGFDNTRENIA